MPVYLTDGRNGLTLIPKEYEGAYLVHYRTPGSKNGQRLYQYKDGSLTPLGYIHYGIGKGRKKTADEEHEAKVRANLEDSKQRMNQKHGCLDRHDDPAGTRKALSKVHIPVESLDKLATIPKDANMDEVLYQINHPDEKLGMIGRSYNCPNCACAFELTERGKYVTARRAPDGSNVGDIERYFKDGHLSGIETKTNIDNLTNVEDFGKQYKIFNKAQKEAIDGLEKTLLTQGDGARGIIVVGWMLSPSAADKTTGFHALNYKVRDGKVYSYDTQSRHISSSGGSLNWSLRGLDPRELYYMQTDILDLDPSITQTVYSHGRG